MIATSSATGTGIAALSSELLRRVEHEEARAAEGPEQGAGVGSAPVEPALESEQLAEHMVFRPAARSGFEVKRRGEGSFVVHGAGVERLLARYDIENEEAMAYLEERLRRMGVLRALESEGFQPGDEIEIGGVSFELDPGRQ